VTGVGTKCKIGLEETRRNRQRFRGLLMEGADGQRSFGGMQE